MPEQGSRRGDVVTAARFTELRLSAADEDLRQRPWYLATNGYLMRFVRREPLPCGRTRRVQTTLHVEVLERALGARPPGMVADHINRNRWDNRRENLRWVSPQQSNWNRRSARKNKTGYIGVKHSATGGKFFAQVSVQNRPQYLGTFVCAVDAARAYDRAVRALGGVDAALNFPEEYERA